MWSCARQISFISTRPLLEEQQLHSRLHFALTPILLTKDPQDHQLIRFKIPRWPDSPLRIFISGDPVLPLSISFTGEEYELTYIPGNLFGEDRIIDLGENFEPQDLQLDLKTLPMSTPNNFEVSYRVLSPKLVNLLGDTAVRDRFNNRLIECEELTG